MTAVPENIPADPKGPNFFQKNKIWFIVIGVFLVSNFSVYFYQRHQQGKLMQEARTLLDNEYKAAEAMTLQRSEEITKTFCRTLVFGIRGEMERGNKADIDLFLNKMVQETGVDLVVIQNAQDSIYLSTDKKYENQKAPYINGIIEELTVLRSNLDEVVVAAPIRGLETRLGTCLVMYKAPKATDELLQTMRQDSITCERLVPLK